jgi:glycerophosphoryl diester phosphodiesterase
VDQMDTIKFEKKTTKIVAHRGLSGIETENTNAAFVAAGNRSYYGIETDIHRTADGRFVVCHDDTLKRVAGVDIPVETTSLTELQSIVLFDKDGTKGREDLRVSILENYISICKKYGKHCVLELKSDFTDEEIAEILNIVNVFDYLENVTFISFIYSNVAKIRKFYPNQSVQFLFSKFTDEIIAKLLEDRIDVDVYYKALTKELIDLFHENGLVVNCWTVDDKEVAENLASLGVDYITTNILE